MRSARHHPLSPLISETTVPRSRCPAGSQCLRGAQRSERTDIDCVCVSFLRHMKLHANRLGFSAHLGTVASSRNKTRRRSSTVG